MPIQKIVDGVYSVGVLNPNLRVFDIIMKTEYGTSYNAYVVLGEKTALIETVHTTFFDEYIENIKQIVDIDKIDYLVLNHTEPDHSGSVKKLLELNPNIKIITSMAGNKYLTKITNRNFDGIIVKDKNEIELGNLTLQFHIAPFLHWPDSMFTYVKEKKLVFTCDMLGCHYCEPRLFDKFISYPNAYNYSFDYYYEAIFSPFKEYVLSGIEKLEALDVEIACPSHGPVLVEGYKNALQKYKEKSINHKPVNSPKKACIVFVSAYGCTKRVADEIEFEFKKSGLSVVSYNAIENDLCFLMEEIESSDAVLFGSPTINKDALKPIWDVVSVVDVFKNKGKLCGVFGSYGWSGEAVSMLEQRLSSLKLDVIPNGVRVNFVPSDEELSKAREFADLFIKKLV